MRIRFALKQKLEKIITSVLEREKQFDYSYFLSKNVPLPVGWQERKE